jgi:aspartate/methionine/tyrosine aminotransferase
VIYSERKTAACKILDELGCAYSQNQSGMFVWAKVPDKIDNVEKWIDEILYATKVFITPGFIFGDAGKRFIRISLCSPVEKMNEALTRIRNFNV